MTHSPQALAVVRWFIEKQVAERGLPAWQESYVIEKEVREFWKAAEADLRLIVN